MALYRKRPLIVEAFKWTGDQSQTEDPDWVNKSIVSYVNDGTPQVQMQIATLEGIMLADRGDYIIKGIKGEIYPCKPDIFEKSYELVTDDFVC